MPKANQTMTKQTNKQNKTVKTATKKKTKSEKTEERTLLEPWFELELFVPLTLSSLVMRDIVKTSLVVQE